MRRGESFRRCSYETAPDRPHDLRYRTSDGYWCLRWNAEGVEILEHRFVTRARPGQVVHHRDHDRGNNDPANLVVADSVAEHNRHHRRVDDETLVELRSQGLTLVEIGERVGLHNSQVSRRLRSVAA